MRAVRTPIRVVALVAALTGCADKLATSEPPETPTIGKDRASVTGRIVDASGAGIAGATVAVRATGERATSGSDGAFTLDVPANTTLTIEASAPNMANTLMPQFMISPALNASFEIPMVARAHLTSLIAMGANAMGGAVVIEVQSLSGSHSLGRTTIDIAPSNLGKVMYMPNAGVLPDPDPALSAVTRSSGAVAWALGVQPHVSTLKLKLGGASQVDMPYSVEDITWLGTFTVDAGALTYLTVFTP